MRNADLRIPCRICEFGPASAAEARRDQPLLGFSLPADPHEVLWHGCARRNINGYVPHYSQDDLLNPDARFGDDDDLVVGATKTFETLAHADTRSGLGTTGLMTLKGDVDNLGLIFRKGLTDATVGRERLMTFAKDRFAFSADERLLLRLFADALCAKVQEHVHRLCRRRRFLPDWSLARNAEACAGSRIGLRSVLPAAIRTSTFPSAW